MSYLLIFVLTISANIFKTSNSERQVFSPTAWVLPLFFRSSDLNKNAISYTIIHRDTDLVLSQSPTTKTGLLQIPLSIFTNIVLDMQVYMRMCQLHKRFPIPFQELGIIIKWKLKLHVDPLFGTVRTKNKPPNKNKDEEEQSIKKDITS